MKKTFDNKTFDNNYYNATVECMNCRYGDSGEHSIEIPKGIRIDDYLRSYKCPLCGCKEMKEKKFI